MAAAVAFPHLTQREVGDNGAISGTGSVVAVIEDRSTVPDYLLLFTVVMGSAFIGELFPAHVADLLRNHHWAKHLMALAFLVVTVIWVRTDLTLPMLLAYTAVTYAWYLALTGMAGGEFLVIIALLFVVFAASHFRKRDPATAVLEVDGGGGKDAMLLATPASPTSPTSPASPTAPKSSALANDWRYWLEFGALTAAAGLTAWFTAARVLRHVVAS